MARTEGTRPQHEDGEQPRPRRGGVRRVGAGPAAKAAATKRQRLHVIEAARMYHALEDPPRKTQADLARETGKSPAYLSILCRIGDAIRDLGSEERDALRQPHLTYTALATLVARHKDRRALLAAIQTLAARPPRRSARSSVGGASLWTRQEPRDPAADPIDPLPLRRGGAAADAGDTFAYTFDAAAWRADPDSALEAFEGHLRTLLDGVMRRAKRALGADARPLVGTGAAPLPRRAPPSSRADRLANLARLDLSLRQLEARVEATRRAHRAHLAAFEVERAAREATRATSVQRGSAPDPASETVTDDEIAADLAD